MKQVRKPVTKMLEIINENGLIYTITHYLSVTLQIGKRISIKYKKEWA